METIDRHHHEREVDIAPRRTHVSRELVITGERAEMLWQMYELAFAPLEELAVQQHLWSREEVLAELADERIVKFIGWSDDRPVGLGMITRHLELVPMISPTFLRRRFPEQAARDAIFYGIMVFVRPDYRGKTMFARLGTHMAEETAQSGGVVLFDVCSFNRDNGELDQNLGRLARPFPRSSMSMVDQQSWFAVELPEAISGRARHASSATSVEGARDAETDGTEIAARPHQPPPRPVDAVVDQLIELTTDEVPALRALAQEEGMTRPGGVRSMVHLAAIVAAWAALVVVGQVVGSIWAWIPIWVCIALLIVGLSGIGHDCVHATLVRSKRLNSVIGHAALATVALPFATYRQFHLMHHVHTTTADDPEGAPADFTSRLQYLAYHLLLGPGFLALIWSSTVRGALGRPPAWARTEHSRRALGRAWIPGAAVVAALALASVTSSVVREAWLVPWLVVMVPVLPFVLLSEHYRGRPADGILHNTYTIESNPLMRFAIYNINFHASHHLLPRVPGVRLRALDRYVAPHGSRRARGYLAFHREVLAEIPWRATTTGAASAHGDTPAAG